MLDENLLKNIKKAFSNPNFLNNVYVKDWEVLKNGAVWDNGIESESECIYYINNEKKTDKDGKFSYRPVISIMVTGNEINI